VLDYDDTLHALDSWYGRPVVVSILPDGCHWYVASVAVSLPKRQQIGLEWLGDDLPHNSEGYSFQLSEPSEKGVISVLQLVRADFRGASIDDEGSLSIEVTGARLRIAPQ
jgi:hypothetical protein